MKQILLLFSILLFATITQAQKIHFTDTSNKWTVPGAGGGTEYGRQDESYFYTRDSVIHGMTYHLLDKLYFIREDTIVGKVYYRMYNMPGDTDTTEYVLYDYTLKVGDTQVLSSFSLVVLSIDSTMIRGVWHKVWKCKQGFHTYNIVEGIGCLSEPFLPELTRFEHDGYLSCFYINGSQPHLLPSVPYLSYPELFSFDNDTSCSTPPGEVLAVKNISTESQYIRVIPNPANSMSYLTFGTSATGTLNMYNALGQLIMKTNLNQANSYPIGNYLNGHGLYFYEFRDSNRTYKGKFIY